MTDVPGDLLDLERAAVAAYGAWADAPAEDGARALTAARDAAIAVQTAITAHAAEAGVDRYVLEMAVKKAVRHPEAA